MKSVETVHIKNWGHYFFNDKIDIKYIDPNRFKINEKSYKNITICYVGYVAPNSLKHFYFIMNKINWFMEESNEDKYLALVSANIIQFTLKEIWKIIQQNQISY